MPTMATLSLIPLLLMGLSLAARTRFPEIVVDAAGAVHAAERHLDLVADRDLLGLAVGHLAENAPAAREVDDDVHRRRVQRVREAIEREGRDLRGAVGEGVGLH